MRKEKSAKCGEESEIFEVGLQSEDQKNAKTYGVVSGKTLGGSPSGPPPVAVQPPYPPSTVVGEGIQRMGTGKGREGKEKSIE